MPGVTGSIGRVIVSFLLLCLFSSAAQAKQPYTGLFGLWAYGDWDAALKLTSDNKFDIAVGVSTQANLDKAQALGLKCLVDLGLTKQITTDDARFQNYLVALKQKVSTFKSHPAVFAWYVVDEPDWQTIAPDKVKKVCDTIRSVDTTKPLFTVLSNRQNWMRYLPYFDIISIDPYLTTTVPGSTDQPEVIRPYIKKMKSDMKKAKVNKPLWLVVGAFAAIPTAPGAVLKYLTPTPAQFNQMVDIGRQEGVEGILVFTLAKVGDPTCRDWKLPLNDPPLWDAVRALPSRVKSP